MNNPTPFKIVKLELGKNMTANCYVLYNENTKEAYVFDPAFDDKKLFDFIKNNDLNVIKIFLTHGHFDHIGGVKRLKDETGADVIISKKDADYLIDPAKNMSADVGFPPMSFEPADIVVSNGDQIEIAPDKYLTVLETPGHTAGSVCYVGDGFVISGDLLFEGSIGRTDFPTGNFAEMCHSLKTICDLDDDTLVFPGHGNMTTIGKEKKTNPYLV